MLYADLVVCWLLMTGLELLGDEARPLCHLPHYTAASGIPEAEMREWKCLCKRWANLAQQQNAGLENSYSCSREGGFPRLQGEVLWLCYGGAHNG